MGVQIPAPYTRTHKAMYTHTVLVNWLLSGLASIFYPQFLHPLKLCFCCALLFRFLLSLFSMVASFCHLPGFFMFWSLLTIGLIPHPTSFYFYFPGVTWEHIALHMVLSLWCVLINLEDFQVVLYLSWPSNPFRWRSLSWLCEGKLTPVFHVLCVHIISLISLHNP